jgi:hypothetical protein
MKEITEQQIRQRANEIGSRPAFPFTWDCTSKPNTQTESGMTYRQWLIGQWIASGDAFIPQVNEYVSEALGYLAKAELEAEQEVQGV